MAKERRREEKRAKIKEKRKKEEIDKFNEQYKVGPKVETVNPKSPKGKAGADFDTKSHRSRPPSGKVPPAAPSPPLEPVKVAEPVKKKKTLFGKLF